ncbi:DUF421 domain-containing protein [Bacillaceae bacterium S4-13-56]
MPDWIHVILRALFFVALFFGVTKWFGKKQMSELSYFEFVVGIAIGSVGAFYVLGIENSFAHSILAVLVFGGVPFLLSILSLKSRKVRDATEGKATVFIKDGKIMEDNLKKKQFTTDALLRQLRTKNIFRTADVEFAVLEPGGSLSVMLKKKAQPITSTDLGINAPNVKEPHTVIMDGEILDDSLASAGKNRQWVEDELSKLGISIENVFLGQADSNGQLTVDIYDDKIQIPSPQQKPLLLASMKKSQADLELFALATEDQAAKEMYEKNAKVMESSIERLKHLLQD